MKNVIRINLENPYSHTKEGYEKIGELLEVAKSMGFIHMETTSLSKQEAVKMYNDIDEEKQKLYNPVDFIKERAEENKTFYTLRPDDYKIRKEEKEKLYNPVDFDNEHKIKNQKDLNQTMNGIKEQYSVKEIAQEQPQEQERPRGFRR